MLINYQILLKQNLQDLNPIFIGESECPPGHKGAANARNCCVLYYVRSGKGKIHLKGVYHDVHAEQFFLVPVGELADIIADEEDPWSFQWIGFNGSLSYDFLQLPPVFDLPKSLRNQLYDLRLPCENMGSRVAGDLFLIHATLTKPKPDRTDHVQRVIDHIVSSYMFKISVADLADELGINSCHLSRQFTKKMGTSIQDYLLWVRVSYAKLYLNRGYSVKETALLCGFNDPNNFTKLYKKKTGFSPTEWKKKLALSEDSRSPFQPYPPTKFVPFPNSDDTFYRASLPKINIPEPASRKPRKAEPK